MVEPVSLNTARDDTLWAVVASMGRTTRVAEIFSNHIAALADKAWREQQGAQVRGWCDALGQTLVLLHALAGLVADADVTLGRRIACFRGLLDVLKRLTD